MEPIPFNLKANIFKNNCNNNSLLRKKASLKGYKGEISFLTFHDINFIVEPQ